MEGDSGSIHVEQCYSIKIARKHGLHIVHTEKRIYGHLPVNTVLYTTMEPCNARLSGNRTCCDRIVALEGKIKTVYAGTRELNTFITGNDSKRRLETEGFKFEMVEETRSLCYKAATNSHVKQGE